ncbi:MAG TPA: DUF4232 domain-containing protein [Candidatus Corynebacterium avicola]|uniref:DUF4232 domain-containing protein n=1 Tax=Candidatus Corynebacterium avicola TaxID=2838527 RepID=A0A9D1RPE5_9CORY|nr:DUF4232 domain-containing protein [Candidatus Corynebacterium avicola]
MKNTHTLTRSAALAAAAVLSLAGIVGCGTDSDSDGGGSGDTGAAASDAVSDTAATEDGDGAGEDAGDGSDGTGNGGGGDSGSSETGEGADGACTADAVTVSLENQQGAAGSALADIAVANDSDSPCTIEGYPGVVLVDDADAPIGAPATREETGGTEAVTLAPGESATSAVKLSQAGNYDEAECSPTPAAGYQVIIPGETNQVVVGTEGQDGLTACANDEIELLSVQPFTPAG